MAAILVAFLTTGPQDAFLASLESPEVCVPTLVDRSGALARSKELQTQIHRGRRAAASQGIIMGGLVRDIGGSARRLFAAMHGVGSSFARYHIVVLENDSKDKTRAGLERECAQPQVQCSAHTGECRRRDPAQHPCCTCEMLHLPEMGASVQTTAMGVFQGTRIVRLTKMRNMLLAKIRGVAHGALEGGGGGFDWVLLFDGDMFADGSQGFSPAGVHALLGLQAAPQRQSRHEASPYDIVCGNQMVRPLFSTSGDTRIYLLHAGLAWHCLSASSSPFDDGYSSSLAFLCACLRWVTGCTATFSAFASIRWTRFQWTHRA